MKAFGRLIPVLGLAFAIGRADASEDIGAALVACRAESDDARRLACYDRAADAGHPPVVAPTPAAASAPAAAIAPATAPAVAAAAPAAEATPEDSFGRERALEHEEAKRAEQESRALDELKATVTAIETRIDGLMTMTLDNGQVWRQNSPDARFRLRVGDPVRIEPGALKSFILSGPSKRSTRVTRIK